MIYINNENENPPPGVSLSNLLLLLVQSVLKNMLFTLIYNLKEPLFTGHPVVSSRPVIGSIVCWFNLHNANVFSSDHS